MSLRDLGLPRLKLRLGGSISSYTREASAIFSTFSFLVFWAGVGIQFGASAARTAWARCCGCWSGQQRRGHVGRPASGRHYYAKETIEGNKGFLK